MEKIGFKGSSAVRIELNDHGDSVSISTDDASFFSKFSEGYAEIYDLAREYQSKSDETEGNSLEEAVRLARVNVDFSRSAIKTIDGIFGEGTIQKYFRNLCEEVPGFLPDANCILDFLEQVTPVIERLFGGKVDRLSAASRERMAKYQPQDHRRPAR